MKQETRTAVYDDGLHLEACRFTIDTEKKRCVEVRRADLWE